MAVTGGGANRGADGAPTAAQQASYLIEQRRRARELVVLLGDGRSVTFLRPPEAEAPAWLNGYGPDLVVRYAHGWAGWRERHIAAGAGDDDVQYTPELLRDILADDIGLLKTCGDTLVQAINARHEERKALRGNSSST